MKKKTIALLLVLMLVFGVTCGGTIAYLTSTDSVTNTFTIGNVKIDLTETIAEVKTAWSEKIIPGTTYGKDPLVTVIDSEPCYVFVKITENISFDKGKDGTFGGYFTYGVRDDWKELSGATDIKSNEKVYWKAVDATTGSKAPIYVLTGDDDNTNGKITINDKVTQEMIDNLDGNPTLVITAYAIQQANMSGVADAWAKLVEAYPAS